VVDREALAFDLYGTMVDPIAISGALEEMLGGIDGLEAARARRILQPADQRRRGPDVQALAPHLPARGGAAGPTDRGGPARHLQRLRQRRPAAAGLRTAWVNRSGGPFDTIGQPPDLTVPSLDRLPAALAG
jgi:hypothetical protein